MYGCVLIHVAITGNVKVDLFEEEVVKLMIWSPKLIWITAECIDKVHL